MNLELGTELWARLEIDWDELGTLFRLPPTESLPLPLPVGVVTVDVAIDVLAPVSAGVLPAVRLRIEGDYQLPGDRLSFAGLTLGPMCHFRLTSSFQPGHGGATGAAPDPGVQLDAALDLEAAFKLPALPESTLVEIQTGDAEGWSRLRLHAEAKAGAGAGVALRAEILDPFALQLRLPGPGGGAPAFRAELDRIGGDVSWHDGKLSGALHTAGSFWFHPPAPPAELPMAEHLASILAGIELAGAASFTLGLTQDETVHQATLAAAADEQSGAAAVIHASLLASGKRQEFGLACAFPGANVVLHPFALLQKLCGGAGTRDGAAPSETGIGFGLTGLAVTLGQEPSFAFEVKAVVGIELPAYLKLSRTELALGLGRALPGSSGGAIRLPLSLPHISRKALGFADGRPINAETRWDSGTAPLDHAIYGLLGSREARDRYNEWLDQFFDAVEQLTGAVNGRDRIAIAYEQGGAWKVAPPAGVTFEGVALRVLMAGVGELQPDGSLKRTDELAVVYQLEGGAWQPLLVRPALQLDGLFVVFPFQNPQQLRIGGTARFVTDGPFREISKIAATVALSAEMVYFALEADGKARFEVPELLPGYAGGSITLGQARVGIGYTKRSLAVAFAGELVLPEKLVDDLDTSDSVGVGVRLPVQSALMFQLDLIPIVLGKVVIPVPMFQFDVDLRNDVSPPLRDPATCAPEWDGLQLVVPNVIRCSLERISYSPLLGIYASSNSNFDGDLQLGTSRNGLRIVADGVFWAYGMDSWAAMLCAPVNAVPFCNNVCVDATVAGFTVHLHVQRPVPTFSPLALFEILALLADPLGYKVNPDGQLANMVRASIVDARVVLPSEVTRLLPDLPPWLGSGQSFTLNLATYVDIVQLVGRGLEPLATAVIALLRGKGIAKANALITAAAQRIDPVELVETLLTHLPEGLRRLSAELKLGVFSARAAAFLTTETEMRELLAGGQSIAGGAAGDRLDRGDLADLAVSSGRDEARGTPIVSGREPVQGRDVIAELARGDARRDPVPARKSIDELSKDDVRRDSARVLSLVEELARGDARRRPVLAREFAKEIARRDQRLRPVSARRPSPAPRLSPELRALFEPFKDKDLDGILGADARSPRPERGLMMMKLNLAVTPGTTLDFLGRVTADGAADFVTAVNSRASLRLPVTGLESLSTSLSGRASLSGRLTAQGPKIDLTASVTAGAWAPLLTVPGLQLSFPGAGAAAALSLAMSSSGAFSATGQVRVEVAGFVLSGAITIAQSHVALTNCRVEGAPWTIVDLGGSTFSGVIGPGHRFSLEGRGKLAVGNGFELGVTLRIAESGVTVAVDHTLRFGPTTLRVRGEGRISGQGGAARLDLDGAGSFRSALAFSSGGHKALQAKPIELEGKFHLSVVEGAPLPVFRLEGPCQLPGMRLVLQKMELPQAISWGPASLTLAEGGGLRLVTSAAMSATFEDPLSILPALLSRIGLDVEFTVQKAGAVGLEMRGEWLLAMRPSLGFGPASFFPIATQGFDWSFGPGAAHTAVTKLGVNGSEILSLLFRTADAVLPGGPNPVTGGPKPLTGLPALAGREPLARKGLRAPSIKPPPSPGAVVAAVGGVIQEGVNAVTNTGEQIAGTAQSFAEQWAAAANQAGTQLIDAMASMAKWAGEQIDTFIDGEIEAAKGFIDTLTKAMKPPQLDLVRAAEALLGLVMSLVRTIMTKASEGVAGIAATVEKLAGAITQSLGLLASLVGRTAGEQLGLLRNLGREQLLLLQGAFEDQMLDLAREANQRMGELAARRDEILRRFDSDVAGVILRQIEQILDVLTPKLPEISAVLTFKNGSLHLDFPALPG